MAKWLITGGCGFLGSNVADEVLGRGDEAIILDNLSRRGSHENREWLRERHGREWRFVETDIRDAQTVARLIDEAKPDVIAHLAGQVAMTTSVANPRLDFETNALGSLNVLEGVRLHSPETVVLYSSTNKVYGDLDWIRYQETETRYVAPDYPEGFDETLPLDFASPYGCSKGCADQYMRDYARMYGLTTVVFRHSSMYGGRQFATFDQGWVGWFCSEALRQARGDAGVTTLAGNGKQVRDVLHADDMRELYVSAAARAPRSEGTTLNVGGGSTNSLSLLELLAMCGELVGRRPAVKHLEPRASDQKYFVADVSAVKRLFNWSPKVSARTGVQRMIEWIDGAH
ncbi:MAG TPA: GDP-mannose 4,6-dehydratase [Thermoanaerobaculia bacterium]|nr:GDP-mannose 4,6-dehydratase [Thermoanaerobaculia bacterium]